MERTTLLLFFLMLNIFVSAQTQDEYYLDFFGSKFELIKDSRIIHVVEYDNELIQPKNKTFSYGLTGKKFLIKSTASTEDPNNPGSVISQTKYIFNDTIIIKNTIDSINLNGINFENNFKVHFKADLYRIYRFKVLSDSSEYETEFLSSDKEIAYNQRTTEDQLTYCLKMLKSGHHLILTDIYYYDFKKKKNYILDFSILLKR